jgi:predicted secreted Zn-dependent protease
MTGNGQCKVTGAKATFSATVTLPRLAANPSHTPELLATWRAYIAGVENSHAADLWFVYDRLRTVESAILASTCETAQSAGAAAVERLKAEAAEYQRSKMPAAQAAK